MSIQTLQPRAKAFWTCCIVSLSLCLSSNTFAQESEPPPPPSAAPSEMPPPPPELPAPPAAAASAPAPAPAPAPGPDGQWVYTAQYGWVFMPYAESYSYVPAYGNPMAFVYGPTLGWRWLTAPWIFGVGPHPYWGQRGYARFAWHAHPWFTPRRVYVQHGAVVHAQSMHMHSHRR